MSKEIINELNKEDKLLIQEGIVLLLDILEDLDEDEQLEFRKELEELLENIRKYEEKQVKQQESKILEQRKVKNTENQRKTTIRQYR